MSQEDDYLRYELRRALTGIVLPDQRPPQLRNARVNFESVLEDNSYRIRLVLDFHDRDDIRFLFCTPGWFRPGGLREFANTQDLTRFVYRQWSEIVENRAVNERMQHYREAYQAAERGGAPAHVVSWLHDRYCDAERHVRRYHQYGESVPDAHRFSTEDLMRAADIMNAADIPLPRNMTGTEIREREERAWAADWVRGTALYGQRIMRSGVIMGVDVAGEALGITPEAEKRGMILLKENLTPKQLKQYNECKHFDVKGGQTGTTYRIHHGRQMNIHALDWRGRKDFGLCFLPAGNLCRGDTMLAQKLTLELQEDEALRIGNRF